MHALRSGLKVCRLYTEWWKLFGSYSNTGWSFGRVVSLHTAFFGKKMCRDEG